jgi:hypothetical protein
LLFCYQCDKEIILNWVTCKYCNTDHFQLSVCLECFAQQHPNICKDSDGWIVFYRYSKEELKRIMNDFSEDNLSFSRIVKANDLSEFSNNNDYAAILNDSYVNDFRKSNLF